MPSSFNQTCIATIHGCGIHVSGGVLVPQLACEMSILRFGAVAQYGIDVGAKPVCIRRRRHERVVELHVHLAEERMEPVIHRCHRCIGGEVGADSSNHLSSNEQVCVGKIEVGISCSRYHEFYWTPPPPESRDVKWWCSTQRPSSIVVCVGGTSKMSSSLFTPSHDCRCTNAILRKYVCSLSSFGGSDTATGCGSFYTLHSFAGIRNHASNRRWRRLVQTSNEPTTRDWWCCPDPAPNPSMSGRSPYNVNFVLLFTCAMNFCVTGS